MNMGCRDQIFKEVIPSCPYYMKNMPDFLSPAGANVAISSIIVVFRTISETVGSDPGVSLFHYVYSSLSRRSILKMTGRVPSEQQAIISFSCFIQPSMMEPPWRPV